MNQSLGRLVVVLTACLLTQASIVHAKDKVELADILSAWKKRQEKARTFHFAWTQSCFNAKGSLTPPGGAPFPSADRIYQKDASCEMDGARMRYSYKRLTLQGEVENESEIREYISAADGEESKIFLTTKRSRFPTGMILKEKRCSDMNSLEVMPLLLIYRALDPEFLFRSQSFQLSPRTGVIDGRECAIVEYKHSDYVRSVWVDPERDYLPLRYMLSSPSYGEVSDQMDISYTNDEVHGWWPDGWRYARPVEQPLQLSLTAKVTKAAIGDAIPKERFQIRFQPGTVVQDDLRRHYYLLGENGAELPVPKKR